MFALAVTLSETGARSIAPRELPKIAPGNALRAAFDSLLQRFLSVL